MSYMLENNLGALVQADPELARKIRQTHPGRQSVVSASRTGRPYLEIDGVSLCSRFDPDAEAETMAERVFSQCSGRGITKLAVFGLGLGYHAAALAKRFGTLYVIEPRLDIIRVAFEHLDLRDVLTQMTFLFQPDQILPDRQTALFVHPPSLRLSPRAVEPWRKFWPDWNQNSQAETVGEFQDRLNDLVGIKRMTDPLDRTASAELEPLVYQARCGIGPLTQAEQLVLLLDELARA